MSPYETLRKFMKSNFAEWGDDVQSDQDKKLPQPPLEKPVDEGAEIIDLPTVTDDVLTYNNLYSAIQNRKNRSGCAAAIPCCRARN